MGAMGSDKHKDPTARDFWYPPYVGPWHKNVRSLCLCGLLGPWVLSVPYTRCNLLKQTQAVERVWVAFKQLQLNDHNSESMVIYYTSTLW